MLRRFVSLLGVCCGAVMIAFFFRTFLFTLFTVPQTDKQPVFLQGDRVLVDRWAYGLRFPNTSLFGYHRWGKGIPRNGDWAVFNSPLVEHGALPDTSALCMGMVMACPGDTVWMGRDGKVGRFRDYACGRIWPIAVPARGAYVQVAPWAARIYQQTLDLHETDSANLLPATSFESIQNGNPIRVRFSRNYYWISSGSEDNLFDSRTFGFVPEEFFLGKVRNVFYSIQPDAPWQKAWRSDRFLLPI